jgi:hypothetical protein
MEVTVFAPNALADFVPHAIATSHPQIHPKLVDASIPSNVVATPLAKKRDNVLPSWRNVCSVQFAIVPSTKTV